MEITINQINKVIQGHRVLDCISVKLNSGHIHGFQGTNGSGKTMLMRAIIGLISVDQGSIQIDGERIGRDIEFPKSIGFLLENPAFLDRYSGLENLKMLASIQKKCGLEDILETLDRVGLSKADAKRPYRKYSLGMKQRLGIAAAIMEKPDIVILDEPTNSLDEAGVALVEKIILEEKDRGALVIISCHDEAILKRVSDYIYKLERGRMID